MIRGSFFQARASRLLVRELQMAAATLLVCLAVLVGAEGVARRLDPRYLDRTRGSTVYSEIYGWVLRPGFRALLHGMETRVNSKGWRGPERPLEKPPGRTRVLMLGDSITFGTRVRDEDVFSARLERRTKHFDVVNLAVEGYGTDQELLVMEREAPRYQPNVVVLNFCLHNDLLNNALRWDDQDGYSPKPWFVLEGDELRLVAAHLQLSPLRRVAQWLRDESHLYGRLSRHLPEREALQDSADEDGILFDRQTSFRLTVRLIDRIAAVARQRGARFLMVMHPDEPGFLAPARLAAKLRAEPTLAGIPMADLGERYRARGLRLAEMLLDFQGHLTPFGHEVAAEEIEVLLAGL